MDDPSLQELIRELREIRIREAETILERLETTLAEAPTEETNRDLDQGLIPRFEDR